MSESTPRRGGLGRGLSALIPLDGGSDGIELRQVAPSAVAPNPRQPRGVFDEAELEGLAASIGDVGLLQPIVVRAVGEGRYELVAGERRLRASRIAGLATIPVLVRSTDDGDLLKEALVENIHRVQLNPLEEAAAYQQLLEDFDSTQEELAQRLGRSRSSIANALRLLGLPPSVQRKVAAGILTAGHAKAVLSLRDRAAQERLADRVVAEGLSVRATEEVARLQSSDDADAPGGSGAPSRRSAAPSPPALGELEGDLSDALQARVRINVGAARGRMQVDFASMEDLERIVAVIARGIRSDISVPGA